MGNASFPWIELSIPIGFVLLLIYIHYKLLCYNFSSDLQSTFIKLSCLSLGIFVISGSHLLIVQPKELAGLPDMIGLMISGIFWMAALIAGLGSLWNKPKIQE